MHDAQNEVAREMDGSQKIGLSGSIGPVDCSCSEHAVCSGARNVLGMDIFLLLFVGIDGQHGEHRLVLEGAEVLKAKL